MKWLLDAVFGKKKLSPKDAAESFVNGCAVAAQQSFPSWIQANLQGLANAGISSERSEELINTRPFALVWFVVIEACEERAIKNLFDQSLADRLHAEIDLRLKHMFRDQDEWVPMAVRLCRNAAEAPGSDPLLGFMEPLFDVMGYDAEDMQMATSSPMFGLGLIDVTMKQPASGWWKRIAASGDLND